MLLSLGLRAARATRRLLCFSGCPRGSQEWHRPPRSVIVRCARPPDWIGLAWMSARRNEQPCFPRPWGTTATRQTGRRGESRERSRVPNEPTAGASRRFSGSGAHRGSALLRSPAAPPGPVPGGGPLFSTRVPRTTRPNRRAAEAQQRPGGRPAAGQHVQVQPERGVRAARGRAPLLPEARRPSPGGSVSTRRWHRCPSGSPGPAKLRAKESYPLCPPP